LGNVPFKQKDRIYKAYKTVLDERYESIDMDKEEKDKMMFEAKLNSLLGGKNQEYNLDKERSLIRSKIGVLTTEITKYETNMAFFANADENNPLFKSVNESISKAKGEIDALKTQIKMINIAENAANKAAEENVVENTEEAADE